MATKTTLKTMKCPTCGANLKVENEKEAIVCVYCGNSIVPVTETVPSTIPNAEKSYGSVLKVEGIKTSSSAMAYMDEFFEEYDWESFVYAQNLSIKTIDDLVVSLKNSSADDKNTWFAYTKAMLVPFSHKVEGCRGLLTEIIEEYKKDNLEAYSVFDAYRRISKSILASKERIFGEVEKALAKAEKYGAEESELNEYRTYLQDVRNDSSPVIYGTVEDIPQVKVYLEEKNRRIVERLASQGISAQTEYDKAKELISQGSYVEALNILYTIKGFLDSEALIDEIDKYYLILDVLEIGGKLYYFKKDPIEQVYSLHETKDGKVSSKALITKINQIVTNYADTLYYLSDTGYLRKYDFSNKSNTIIEKSKRFSDKSIYIYDKKAILLSTPAEGSEKHKIEVLDLSTGTINTIVEGVKKVLLCKNNKIAYTHSVKNQDKRLVRATSVIDVDTLKKIEITDNKIDVCGFGDDYVVYTVDAPNERNRDIYIQHFNSDEALLLEKNIYSFCHIIQNKVFYYIGNSKKTTLININIDGTERKEWPMYISEVLMEQGGWIYFIRRVGYNSILCKSRLNGSDFKVVAADIEKFVDLKNGYLYYINFNEDLVKVRMDGSNLQELCEDVKEVLLVKEDKIVFVSTDEVTINTDITQLARKRIESVYVVDFTGSGKKKLVYDIKDAKKYDEDSIYYIVAEKIKDKEGFSSSVDILYELSLLENETKKILELKEVEGKQSSFTPANVGLVIAIVALVLLFMCFCLGNIFLIILDLLVGLTGLAIFFVFKYAIPDKNNFKVLFGGLSD